MRKAKPIIGHLEQAELNGTGIAQTDLSPGAERNPAEIEVRLRQRRSWEKVLVTEAVNTDMAGRPIQYSRTHFAADRVELKIDRSNA